MKILHLTDLHYTNEIGSRTKQQKLIENFIGDLEQNVLGINFVIFSGDLVQNGGIIKDFELAQTNFVEEILKALKIERNQLFICAGNHDVHRGEVSNSIIKYIDEEISNNYELDDFFRKGGPDLENSHKPLLNYRNFIGEFYADLKGENDYFEEIYSTHIRKSKEGKIGFVCLNTAWRAVGQNDETNLVFPLAKVDEALDRIINCDIKIVVHHPPLSNIKPYNLYDLEDLLHKRFDLMFSGHVHKNILSLDLTPNDGVMKLGTSANLSFDIASQIGYTIVNLNYEDQICEADFRMYDVKNEVFYPIPTKNFSIPTSKIKEDQNKLRKNIRKRFLEELEESKNLFVESKNRKDSKNLFESSTEPVLKDKSLSEMLGNENQSYPDFTWSTFYDFAEDYLIFGKDKCGKTVLLKKIELELLNNYATHDFMPFYIDVKYWSTSEKKFDFEKEFAKTYFVNISSAKKIISSKNVIILIDNYHTDDSKIKDSLEEVAASHENFRLIVCAISSSLSSFDNQRFNGRSLRKLYFHRLRKKHIKALTKKNYNLPEEREEQIVEKINTIFKKLSIPFNYWTVSIFLWVFNKNISSGLHNDVDLINLYIEKLLEKEQLTVSATTFTFSNYKKLLAHLAQYLLTNHHKTSYYAKYSEIIDFIQKQLDKNPRQRTNPKDIFEYLDNKGLLRKKEPDLYSFRLNGVFEYFVAHYMTLNHDFLNKAIDDKDYYLSFANEFELFAGFERSNIKFLKRIYEKTQGIFSELVKFYDLENSSLDQLLVSKVYEADELGNLIDKYSKKFKDGLTEAEQDKVEEELIREMKLDDSHSEVRRKSIKSINNSSEPLEDSLTILGKVYRNIDDIDASDLVYEIFDYIIDSACLWSFKLLDEFGEMDIPEIVKTDLKGEAKHFLNLISNIIPTLVQVRLYNMLGHVNLEGILLERLELAKKKPGENQLKLFIFTFLLLDINYNQHKQIIQEIIPLIKTPIIKYSFILKLNYYLGFKNNLTAADKKSLRNNIQSQYLKFNNKLDVGDVQKSISGKQKRKTD